MVFSENKELQKKLQRTFLRHGKLSTLIKQLDKFHLVFRQWFGWHPFFLIKYVIHKTRPSLELKKYKFKNREFIFPKIVSPNKQYLSSLKNLTKATYAIRRQFLNFHTAFIYVIVENALNEDKETLLSKANSEISELAFQYRYKMYEVPRKRRKYRNKRRIYNVYKYFKYSKK